jgi:hypothetical protein
MQVALDPGLHVDIDHRRRGPLVLPDLRHDVGGDGDPGIGRGAPHGLPRPPLHLGIGEAVEEGDGDRLDPGGGQFPGQALDILLVQIVPRQRRPIGESAPRHAEAEVARHEGMRHLELQVVEVVAMLAADLQGIAEALAGEERGQGSLALDQRVGDQGRAMDDLAEGAHRRVGGRQRLLQPGLDGTRRIVRCGEGLPDDERAAGVVIDDQVGEGAADIDAGAQPHSLTPNPLSWLAGRGGSSRHRRSAPFSPLRGDGYPRSGWRWG